VGLKIKLNTYAKQIGKIIILLALLLNFIKYLQIIDVKAEPNYEIPEDIAFKEFEREDLRTITSKTFQIDKNKFRVENFINEVHYESNKRFEEIDNSIIEEVKDGFSYKNKGNRFTFRAGESLSQGALYEDGNNSCGFYLTEIEGTELLDSKASIENNTIKYKDIYPGADLEYTILSEGIRTEIVVKDKLSLKKQFTFSLYDCKPDIFDKPTISDKDDIGIIPFAIEKSDKDSVGKRNINENQQRSQNNSKLRLKPDYQVLNDINGEVRIDPSITQTVNIDTFITPSTLNPNNGMRRAIPLGTYTDYTVCLPSSCPPVFSKSRGLFKFGKLNISSNALIQNSKLEIWHYGTNPNHGELMVSKVIDDWDESVVWPGPRFEGEYGRIKFLNYNSDNIAQKREVTLSNNLIKKLSIDDFGIQVKNVNDNEPGVVICSRNIPSPPCLAGMEPKLIFEYINNNPPSTPSLKLPINNSYLSGNCDESVMPLIGICRASLPINFEIENIGDVDPSPGDLDKTIIDFFDLNGVYLKSSEWIYGSRSISSKDNLIDGKYRWKARSVDKQGLWGNYSEDLIFNVDTSPPEVPKLEVLPEFSAGVGIEKALQIELFGKPTNDNLSPQAETSYKIQYSIDPTFINPYEKVWQLGNAHFEISSLGADGVGGTPDDLLVNRKYYFRLKAKDQSGNISNWSDATYTTLDNINPVIRSFSSSLSRFSPKDPTSLGIKDFVDVICEFAERNPLRASIVIYSDLDRKQKVFQYIEDISSKDIDNIKFTWNGRDSGGNDLKDGLYSAYISIEDKAGNLTESSAILLVIDNSKANISISTPLNNFWTNIQNIPIKGQVTAPNEIDKEDGDIENLNIYHVENTSLNDIHFDELGFFETNSSLLLGSNKYKLKSVDTVGNTEELSWDINYENISPEVYDILPNNLIDDRKPVIKFKASDIGAQDQLSGLIIGKNPSNAKVALNYSIYDPKTSLFISQTKLLIDQGVNLDPNLIDDLNCFVIGGANVTSKNGYQSSDKIGCELKFLSDLSLDTIYTISVEISDIAGNVSKNAADFNLDTHIFSEIKSPISNSIYATNSVQISGLASKNSIINLSHIELNGDRQFLLNENLNGSGRDPELSSDRLITSNFEIQCGEFNDVDHNIETQNEELCYWRVYVLQKTVNNDRYVDNTIRISVNDIAKNSIVHTIKLKVNLYAVNLEVSSNLNYFSPNGDGNQDGVEFIQTLKDKNGSDLSSNLKSFELKILNDKGKIVKIFNGGEILYLNTFWDGKYGSECNLNQDLCESESVNRWVLDGKYIYILTVITHDNISFSTAPKVIYARTNLDEDVVITTPKNGYITTRGVITIQGQAPKSQEALEDNGLIKGDITVDICIDVEGTIANCDFSSNFPVDQNGFFSGVVVLPRLDQAQTNHLITAIAKDKFGNVSKISNKVNVIQDTIDPFTKVSITPTLSGISYKEDYAKFLKGEISLDRIRSLELNATVTQNTQQVEFNFAEGINLEMAENSNYGYIATVNNRTETEVNLNPYKTENIKKNYKIRMGSPDIPEDNCPHTSCLWRHQLPLGPDLSGIYEIQFKGKKGDKIEEMSAGFKIDGNIPASPYIMVVERWVPTLGNDSGEWVSIDNFEGEYYTNQSKVRVRGASEPNIKLQLIYAGRVIDTFSSSAFGIWEKEIVFNNLLSGSCKKSFDTRCLEGQLLFSLNAIKEDKYNNIIYQIPSSNSFTIHYDIDPPKLNDIKRLTPEYTVQGWIRSGTKVDYIIDTGEKLKYADIIKEDGFVRLLSNNTKNLWIGTIVADRKEEGFFKPKIRLRDLAGNNSLFDSNDPIYLNSNSTIKDWRVYIDNTSPQTTIINTDEWKSKDGIDADGIYPEIGRLNPQFVTRSEEVLFNGRAERGQRVEIYVNNKFEKSVKVDEGCSLNESYPSKITFDGLLVQDNVLCSFSYNYKFPKNGKSHLLFVPTEYYIIQTKVLDNAGNRSELSPQIIVYHDTKSPDSPTIESNKYLVTNSLNINLKIKAERLSDLEILFYGPKGDLKERRIVKNPIQGFRTEEFKLGQSIDAQSHQCIKLEHRRRLGICEDGEYLFRVRSIDGPGNWSEATIFKIERDTVEPSKPETEISTNRNLYTLKMNIKGEKNAKAFVNIAEGTVEYKLNSRGNLLISDLVGVYYPDTKYETHTWLVDSAGNIGEMNYAFKETSSTGFCFQGNNSILNMPLKGKVVASKNGGFYAKRDGYVHVAQDFTYATSKDSFDKPVFAASDGIIVLNQKGNYIYDDPEELLATHINIRHDSKGLVTEYAHLNQDIVTKGHLVKSGQMLGTIGNTGNVYPAPRSAGDTRGSHLHFAVKVINPNSYINYSRYKQWDSIYVDPMQLLSTECRGKEGAGRGDGYNYDNTVEKSEALLKFQSFIQSNLESDSVIHDKRDKKLKVGNVNIEIPKNITVPISKITDINQTLENTVYQWCGIWSLELDHISEKNGDRSSDGILILNPNTGRVYLIKDEIWWKYKDTNGPCGDIGIPKDSNSTENYSENISRITQVYKVKDNQIVTSGKYQNFENNKYTQNQIIKYTTTWSSGCLIGYIKCNTNQETYIYFTLGKVANWYREAGGVDSIYGFPVEDTQRDKSPSLFDEDYCSQRFSYKNSIDLCGGEIGIPISIDESRSDKYREERKSGVNYDDIYVSLKPIPPQSNLTESIKSEYLRSLDKYTSDKDIWIITHGFSGSFSGNLEEIGKEIKDQYPESIVLGLDWSDPAYGKGLGLNLSVDNCRVATWIKPVADDVYKRLDKWGVKDGKKIHLVGHSLGTLMNTEIAKDFGEVDSFIALDPPSELNCKYYGPNSEDKYIVQQSPAVLRNDFKDIARFSRSFIGKWSVGGNESLSKSALESLYMNFDGVWDNKNPSQHSWVVNSFKRLVTEVRLEKINDIPSLSIKDLQIHPEWQAEYEGKCHAGKGVFKPCKRITFNGHNGQVEIYDKDNPQYLETFINGIKRRYERDNK
jgi:murein DD-endopeptidase MepM/ murein hydrolase activator NlpD/pimeloyl-ACP methyl ester carboxylesterase